MVPDRRRGQHEWERSFVRVLDGEFEACDNVAAQELAFPNLFLQQPAGSGAEYRPEVKPVNPYSEVHPSIESELTVCRRLDDGVGATRLRGKLTSEPFNDELYKLIVGWCGKFESRAT